MSALCLLSLLQPVLSVCFRSITRLAARSLAAMTSALAPAPAAPAASFSVADSSPAAPAASVSAADSSSEVDLPAVSSIAECVQFYWDSLTTKQRCGLRKRAGSIWRVGTACSGTDSVVKVLEHLGRSSGWTFTHAFSCECDEAKQEWVQENFPEAPLIFPDICELHTGRALNIVTREVSDIPAVDVFVAGFVCKSVSTENAYRGSYSQCIAGARGPTGETFAGVLGYVRRFRPKLVICENVSGLLKRAQGCDAQIYQVRKAFEEVGYAFAYKQVDARNFLVPQRRTRVWMWAIRSDVAAAPAVGEVQTVLNALERPQPVPLNKFLRPAACEVRARQTLNDREEHVLDHVFQANRSLQRLEAEELTDLVIDVAKSAGRAPWCIGATPCVMPNSRLHWRRQHRVLGAHEMAGLQGIWPRDFTALESWCQSDTRSRVLMDMAGNAFTSTVCAAVCLGVMVAISPC